MRWAIRLPWARGPSRRTAGVVSATQTDFDRFRDIPGAVVAALRLRRLVRRSPGAIGVSLSMRPLRRRSWSVSAWETEDDLRRFLRSASHQATARRFRSRVGVRSELWAVDRFDLSGAWHQADALFTPTVGHGPTRRPMVSRAFPAGFWELLGFRRRH
jgi:heme-degrading monooxygenase HmoA